MNNACSSGSTALMMARQFIEGGLNDCVLALGFEKMEKGSLTAKVRLLHYWYLDLCSRCSFSILIKLINSLLSHFEHQFTIVMVRLALQLYSEYVVTIGLNGLV